MLLLIPIVAISCGSCDKNYSSDYWRLSTGWLVWSFHLDFSEDCL